MKKLTAIATLVLIATSATASAASYRTGSTHMNATYLSDTVGSMSEAQSIAENYIASLNQSTGQELWQQFPTPHSQVNSRSLAVDGTDWSIVQTNNGYQAKVDIDYSYEYRYERD
jgi:hypothetical protein